MASNQLPTNAGQLIGLGNKMYQGILNLGTSVGVTMVTAAQMLADLNAFISADGAFNAGRSAKQAASDDYQVKLGTIYDWLMAARNVLVPKFGVRWSTEWAQAGFTNPSTSVPVKIEDRLALVLALGNFFTANPGYEVASLGVTAAQATSLRTAALAAQQLVTNAAMALKTIGDTWTSAYETLTATMRALIKNLEGKLGKDDPRWLGFGLEMPGTSTTPGKPVNLTAHIDDTGSIIVTCDAVALAMRYRWRGMLVGVETDYRLVARSTDPIGSIAGVMPGQKIQIIVQAVNGTLQGVASDPIQFTVPLAKNTTANAEPGANGATHVAEATLAASNGNGSDHRRPVRA